MYMKSRFHLGGIMSKYSEVVSKFEKWIKECNKIINEETVTELKKKLPKGGHNVETPQGTGKVVSIDVFNNTYSVDLKEKGIIKIAGDNNKDGNDK